MAVIDTLKTRPAGIQLDPAMTTGHVLMVVLDEDLDSMVLRFTPAQAARLGQALIDTAARLEMP
jgi:hypothetical protein